MESLPPANNNEIVSDLALPFMIDASGTRGSFVRLGGEVHKILSGHKYPVCVSQLLGELLILVAMLGNMLKLKGIISIQAQGDGAVDFLSADYTSEGHLRGYVKIRNRKKAQSICTKERKKQDITELLGKGHIIITIENQNDNPYQAIVALEGKNLSACIANYFRQSEQLEAKIEVAVNKVGKHWVAGGLVIQRVPKEGGRTSSRKKEEDMNWESASILLDTVTDEELLDNKISPHTLLYRLFHEDGVRVFEPQKLKAKCRCSREKIINVLSTLTKEELNDMKVDGFVKVTCKFCNKSEKFKEGDW